MEVPGWPDWIHEIKYDGYRVRVEREGDRVRLFSRNGHDWTDRYPWIVESALKNRIKQFVIDGEAVVLGVDGIPALHSRKHDEEVQLYAFDILALDGGDLRGAPLSLRKTNLARLLARRPDGIFVAPYEQGSRRPQSRLGQGEKPQAPGDRSREGCLRVKDTLPLLKRIVGPAARASG